MTRCAGAVGELSNLSSESFNYELVSMLQETLSKLGGQLAETMQRMTRKFKLGFGSFVDKVVMPFVSTVEKK